MNLCDLTIVCPTSGYAGVARSLYTFKKTNEKTVTINR